MNKGLNTQIRHVSVFDQTNKQTLLNMLIDIIFFPFLSFPYLYTEKKKRDQNAITTGPYTRIAM